MKRKNFFASAVAIVLGITFILRSGELSEGIRKGLSVCSYSVIPSLFPFMALSCFIAKSSASEVFAHILSPITGLFKLPKICGSAVLASVIGGYPAAAKCINDLVAEGKLDRKTAERMLCFSVNAGPAFLITAVGIGVFGNIKIGALLFFSQMLSAFIIGCVSGIFVKKPKEVPFLKTEYKNNSTIIIESVISAAESCFRMCAFIVLSFGALEFLFNGSIFSFLGENAVLKAVFIGFFEVTSGVYACGEVSGFAAVVAAGAVASFSGISVILQVGAVTEKSGISLLPFFASRFVHAGITSAILWAGLRLSGDTVSAFSVKGSNVEALLSASAPAAVSLLCMASLFLLSIVPPKSEKISIFSRILHKFPSFRHSQTH